METREMNRAKFQPDYQIFSRTNKAVARLGIGEKKEAVSFYNTKSNLRVPIDQSK